MILNELEIAAFALLGLALLLALLRLVLGPKAPDRVVASDTLSVITTIGIVGLALVLGTAGMPHILMRFFTVPTAQEARKSVVWAMAIIGGFYVLTLFMGLGAMTHGVLDLGDSNMSAPLLAKFFGIFLFSCISAIAFATVLGTVSYFTIKRSRPSRLLAAVIFTAPAVIAQLGGGEVGLALLDAVLE